MGNLSKAVNTFPMHILTSLSVDEKLLPIIIIIINFRGWRAQLAGWLCANKWDLARLKMLFANYLFTNHVYLIYIQTGFCIK